MPWWMSGKRRDRAGLTLSSACTTRGNVPLVARPYTLSLPRFSDSILRNFPTACETVAMDFVPKKRPHAELVARPPTSDGSHLPFPQQRGASPVAYL